MTRPVTIRELDDPLEFAETANVAKAAWRFSDWMVSPPPDLIAGTHSGGLTAGAFEGKRMVGFVHGIPRTNRGCPCQHSHLLAVRPDVQGRGLAAELKLFQRRWCLERGIELVTWTYDPFLLKNARLNIVRLRGTVKAFLPDFYGPMGGIYGDLPTDRFEVEWRLSDPLVARAADGGERSGAQHDPAALPVATPRKVPSAPVVALPFPKGAPDCFRTDLKAGMKARRDFARAAKALFERGYVAVSVVELPSGLPAYVLERSF